MIKSGSPKKTDRVERMLEAAQTLILRNGLRGTTMEEIAREAGVAKPTLYKYFPDKGAIYETLMTRFIGTVKQSVDEALSGEGSTEARVAAALTAKKKFVFKLLHTSPHARELYDDDPDIPKDEVVAFERYFEDELTSILEAGGHETPRYMAQILIACAEGIGKRAQFIEQIGPAIRLVTQKMLA